MEWSQPAFQDGAWRTSPGGLLKVREAAGVGTGRAGLWRERPVGEGRVGRGPDRQKFSPRSWASGRCWPIQVRQPCYRKGDCHTALVGDGDTQEIGSGPRTHLKPGLSGTCVRPLEARRNVRDRGARAGAWAGQNQGSSEQLGPPRVFLWLLAFCQTDPWLTCPQPPAVTVTLTQHTHPQTLPCGLQNEV